MTLLICYRFFYITVSLNVLFQNVYLGYIPYCTGPYILQFMKVNLQFYNVFFEEIYSYTMPYSMFHLSGGVVHVANSSFINIGYKTNDTSGYFSPDDNAVLYFYNEKAVLVESCVCVSINVSLHTGQIIYSSSGGNFTLVNSYLKNNHIPGYYSMGVVMMGANLSNNTFIGLQCPNSTFRFSRFQHINGPIAMLGEAVYARRKNNRIAYVINNTFINCICKNGGSLCIINFNTVYINNLQFQNSYAVQTGGSFSIMSASLVNIQNIQTTNSESLSALEVS